MCSAPRGRSTRGAPSGSGFRGAFKPGSPDHAAMTARKTLDETKVFDTAWMERLLAEVAVEKTHVAKYAKTTLRVGSMTTFGKGVERSERAGSASTPWRSALCSIASSTRT